MNTLSIVNLTMLATSVANSAWSYQQKPCEYGAKELLRLFNQLKNFVFDKQQKNEIIKHVLYARRIDESTLIELCESLQTEIKISELTGKLTLPEYEW